MYKQIYRKCIFVGNYSRKHVLKKKQSFDKKQNKTIQCTRHALPKIAEEATSELQGLQQLYQRKITIYSKSVKYAIYKKLL